MTLEPLTSDLLQPARHAFYTRRGGASSGVFEGLNTGYGSSDQREVVAINRARVADHMDVSPDDLVTVHQIHSPDVVILETAPDTAPKADGMVTRNPDLALGVLTADCQPVLFADPGAGVVGAAHAGWRGALDGVLEATIQAMETIGATRSAIRAAIGPTISQSAYEVGPEFLDRFLADDPENHRFFAGGKGDRMHFDLIGYSLARLRAAGIADVEWIGRCTYADDNRFFSYRRSVHRNEPDYGRLISVIRA